MVSNCAEETPTRKFIGFCRGLLASTSSPQRLRISGVPGSGKTRSIIDAAVELLFEGQGEHSVLLLGCTEEAGTTLHNECLSRIQAAQKSRNVNPKGTLGEAVSLKAVVRSCYPARNLQSTEESFPVATSERVLGSYDPDHERRPGTADRMTYVRNQIGHFFAHWIQSDCADITHFLTGGRDNSCNITPMEREVFKKYFHHPSISFSIPNFRSKIAEVIKGYWTSFIQGDVDLGHESYAKRLLTHKTAGAHPSEKLLPINPATCQYSFVFVDDAQDMTKAQYRLIEVLFPKSHIVYVGDVMQSICSRWC